MRTLSWKSISRLRISLLLKICCISISRIRSIIRTEIRILILRVKLTLVPLVYEWRWKLWMVYSAILILSVLTYRWSRSCWFLFIKVIEIKSIFILPKILLLVWINTKGVLSLSILWPHFLIPLLRFNIAFQVASFDFWKIYRLLRLHKWKVVLKIIVVLPLLIFLFIMILLYIRVFQIMIVIS